MCRRFSAMYGTGLSVTDCLSSLARESESKRLSAILGDIHEMIRQGRSIADAFSKYPKVFPVFFVNMIRVGETTGNFEYVLNELDLYMEKQQDLRRKIRQALTYPVVVLVMIFLVVAALMMVVMPVFGEVYTKLGVDLPLPTITLISLSNNAVYIFPALIGLLVGLWIVYKKLSAISTVRRYFDGRKLSLPLIGTVYHKITLLRFVRTLGLMINAGIPLSDALSIAQAVANNAVISEAADMIQRSINSGGTLTLAVSLHDFFPQSVVHSFAAGERAGNLGEMLAKVAMGIERDVDDMIKRLITKFEPILTTVLSLVVGFILIAIYLPIFDLIKALRTH
ncbi:type II secretion system F family protein [Planctomycetota bacterium]